MADTRGMVQPTAATVDGQTTAADEWATDGDDDGTSDDGRRNGDEGGRATDVPGGTRKRTSFGGHRITAEDRAKAEELRLRRREEFRQLVANRPPRPSPFTGTRFPAWLSPTGIKLTKLGDAQITFTVPYRFRDAVLDLIRNETMILDVDIDPWENENPVPTTGGTSGTGGNNGSG